MTKREGQPPLILRPTAARSGRTFSVRSASRQPLPLPPHAYRRCGGDRPTYLLGLEESRRRSPTDGCHPFA